MAMLNLALSLVDGGATDIPVRADDFERLRRAAVDGLVDWSDFAEIIGDDWAAPPRRGTITGKLDDGKPVEFGFGIGDKPRPGRRR